MENSFNNTASLVSSPFEVSSRILMDKAAGDAPLFKIMRIYATGKNHHLYKHGLKGTPLYIKWKSIKGRLFNPNNSRYEYYGGRGITMYPLWIHNAKRFCDYIESLPNYNRPGFTSIDRIDNDGNYEPGNLRWATKVIQRNNQRLSKLNKTGYFGINFLNRIYKPWNAHINVNKKRTHIGNYATLIEAVVARNNYIIGHNLTEYKLNEIN